MNCKKLLSIGKTANILGVHIDTLREWDRDEKLVPVKTPGGHRRYRLEDIEAFCGEVAEKKDGEKAVRVVTYSRVSSHEQKQKGDLERQNGRVLAYCVKKKYQVVKSYEEVGSGMCDTRPKLHQMFKMVENKEVDKVIVEHKDRLTRFNFNFLAAFFASHGVEVEWTEEVLGNKRYEDELVEDMLTLMSSFSNKIYGKRSAENRKKKKLEKLAALGQPQPVVVEEIKEGILAGDNV
jgi:predicted site-specific integrase-resolvase